jgi:hypothetical protein
MKIFIPTAAQWKLATIYGRWMAAFQKHNANRGVSWVFEPSVADIIILFEEWGTRFWNYSDVLKADPFLSAHWDRIFTINWDDLGRGFLPGCYTSLTKANFETQLHRACAYPYNFNVLVASSPSRENPTTKWLFSFRGTDRSHPIRRKLFRHFATDSRAKMVRTAAQFRYYPFYSAREQQEYVADILLSKFVLCPRGSSPVTHRLFEVMELGRCPVIISDDWVPIQGLPWEQCSVVIKEREISYCADILSQQEPNAEHLGRAAREAWELHFAEPKKFRAMLDCILELMDKRDGTYPDYRERWSSWRFHYSNRWLPHQRLAERMTRRLDWY